MSISKTRQRLENLHERLRDGDEVSLRDFRNAISEEDWENYEFDLEQRKQFASGYFGYSETYEAYLKKGIFAFNKAQGARADRALNRRYQKDAESWMIKALDHLRDEVASNPGLALAYDRDVNDECDTSDPIGMPRLKLSKSASSDASARKLDKRGLKIRIIEKALQREKEEEGKRKVRKKEGDEEKRDSVSDQRRASDTRLEKKGTKKARIVRDARSVKLADLLEKLQAEQREGKQTDKKRTNDRK